MLIKKKLIAFPLITLMVICCCSFNITGYFGVSQPSLSWTKKVGAKHFPQGKKVYKVNNYGAVNDGKTMNTKAIQKAIDDCAAHGGGIVSFDPGQYLTGSIYLKSGVHLQLDKGVTLLGSQDIKDYPEINTRIAGFEMKWPSALVNVIGQHNVAITGEGIIDGQGKPFWDMYWRMRKVYDPKGLRWVVDYDAKRPRTLLVQKSEDVTIKDIQLQKAGFWTVHILYSKQITVDGIKIRNNIGGHGPSTDGIDIDSSTFILVENCDIDCNDDDFCLKAGRDEDGLRVNKPTEYVLIRKCIARAGGGLLTIGSETSGSIHHVLLENSEADGTSNGINFKSAITRGGTVSDIHVRNLEMKNVRTVIRVSMNWNPSYSYSKLPAGYDYDSIPHRWKILLEKVPPGKGIPTMKDIYISDITATECRTAIDASGMKQSLLDNFNLNDISIKSDKAGEINYAKNWHFDHVDIKAADNSSVKVEHADGVKL